MSLPSDINPQLLALSSGYNLTRSLRFRSSASGYLNRTPTVAGSRTTWTWSGWVKIGVISSNDNALFMALNNASGVYNVNDWSGVFLRAGSSFDFIVGNGGSVSGRLITTQAFRDFSSWYHLVFTYDSTNATSTERMRMYVNGARVTAFSTATYPSINTNSYQNTTNSHFIGQSWLSGAPSNPFDGYLAEVNFIDGQALTPASFGSTNALTGVWQPAAYTGSYGTNGFELQFTDNSAATAAAIGKDSSGNGNNWTPNNISVTAGVTYDSMTDVPTLTSATASNFAVLNPLTGDGTISNANLTIAWSGGNSSKPATIGVNSGKWYCEILLDSSSSNAILVGIIPSTMNPSASYPGSASGGYGYFGDGQKYFNGVGSAYGSAISNGDIVGIAFDLDNGKVWFSRNGTWQASGDPAAGTNAAFTSIPAGTWFLSAGHSGTCTMSANFGQRPFTYTPPTGFVALNTFNLPTNTIVKGNTNFNAVLYTGTGSAGNSITGVGFQPDFNWIKTRSTISNHLLTDSVRGTGRSLFSNLTDAESTTRYITSLDSDGFTVGTPTDDCNESGRTFVAWNWKAGGTAVTNTAGTISAQVSANPTAGFSVVTYTGTGSAATIGHGLGVAPQWIIVKNRDAADAWQVYHANNTANPETDYLVLNTTAATADAADRWNDTAPTSSVFSIGNGVEVNTNTEKYVAYCWTPIAGYSAFGSYTGNGSTDGPFVYTGFQPKWVLVKKTSATDDWVLFDAARSPYNAVNNWLFPQSSAAELTGVNSPDFLSNGFKMRSTSGATNGSGATFIYMAFAENPFKNSLAR